MNRKEYMEQLSKAMEGIEPDTARDILEDYEAHFERALEAGKNEAEIISELGSVEEFIEELGQFIPAGEGKRTPEKTSVKRQEEPAGTKNPEEAAGEKNPEASMCMEGTGAGNNQEKPAEVKNPEASVCMEGRGADNNQEEATGEKNPETNMCVEGTGADNNQEASMYMKGTGATGSQGGTDRGQNMDETGSPAGDRRNGGNAQDASGRDNNRYTYHSNGGHGTSGTFHWDSGDFSEKINNMVNNAVNAATSHWDNEKDFSEKINNMVNSAVNAATSGLGQLSNYFDRAFGNFGDWVSGFEKSGESEEDYRKRQEDAKYREKGAQGKSSEPQVTVHAKGTSGKNPHVTVYTGDGTYYFSPDEDDTEDTQYMSECNGILYEEDGIRHISVDSKSAEVTITASPDNAFHYTYQNDGSAGSKIVYRLEKKCSRDMIFLNIRRDEQVQRKNHFKMLGGIFEDSADLELHLQIPDWMESLVINGKSGDISMLSCKIHTLQFKTMSGDIRFEKSQVERGMAESRSGDINAADSHFDYVLASATSGDVRMKSVRAQKAACRSMSGDASVINCEFGEAAITSQSGDACVSGCGGGTISAKSVSGDTRLKELSVENTKATSTSGDVDIAGVKTQNALITTISGDICTNGLEADILKASATSGDMSIRGASRKMTLTNGSGDIIVVQNGNTEAVVTTRSGDVYFHLKNNGDGFVSRVSTHGDIQYRYNDLHLNEAANGQHRYGAEGSKLDIRLTSGDISITD